MMFSSAPVRFLGETNVILDHCRNCGGFWLDAGELNLVDQELVRIMPVDGHGFSDFVNKVHVPYWFKRINDQVAKPISKLKWNRLAERNISEGRTTIVRRAAPNSISIQSCRSSSKAVRNVTVSGLTGTNCRN